MSISNLNRSLADLPAWERLFKRIVWLQMGEIKGKRILDFGSGEGITADYLAAWNEVVAVEPDEAMLRNAWRRHPYRQIMGNVSALETFPDESFDVVICHNVLEYIEEKSPVLKELARVLKPGGFLSLVKHHRNGRIMQMAVLLDDADKANDLLDGHDSVSSKFGVIRYYSDPDAEKWAPSLRLQKVMGIRSFWDLQQNQEKHADEVWQQKMVQLEHRILRYYVIGRYQGNQEAPGFSFEQQRF